MDITPQHQHYTSMNPQPRLLHHEAGLYTINVCNSATPSQLFPSRACCKSYRQPGAESQRELRVLQALQELNLQGLHTTQYLYHYLSHGRLVLYFDAFDGLLSEKIAPGEPLFGEKAVWHCVYTLAKTLSTLHAHGLYHRNVSSKAIFQRNGDFYLGNFDDAIELPNGMSNVTGTLRDKECLSPQIEEAMRQGSDFTYGQTKKEDAWGLGCVALEMATGKHVRLEQLFSLPDPQKEIDGYIEQNMRNYSVYLRTVIKTLLRVDHHCRPEMDFYCTQVLALYYRESSCEVCRQPLRMVWTCEHLLCDRCYFDYLRLHRSRNQLRYCDCDESVDEELMRSYSIKVRLMHVGLLQRKQPCVTEDCPGEYEVLVGGDCPEPHFHHCDHCGQSYCSFCHCPKPHQLFGKARPCVVFNSHRK